MLLDVLEAGQDDHLALVAPGGPRLTYRRLREEVLRAAHVLATHGVRRGDRIAVSIRTQPRRWCCFWRLLQPVRQHR